MSRSIWYQSSLFTRDMFESGTVLFHMGSPFKIEPIWYQIADQIRAEPTRSHKVYSYLFLTSFKRIRSRGNVALKKLDLIQYIFTTLQ